MKLLINIHTRMEDIHKELQRELHRVFIELKSMNAEEKAKTIEELKEKYEKLRNRREG